MTSNPIQRDKAFKDLILTILEALEINAPSIDDVNSAAKQAEEIMQYDGNIEAIVREILIAVDTHMGIGTSLVSIEIPHDEEWVSKRDNITWTYSDAYMKFLRDNGWHKNFVLDQNHVCNKILGHMQDPTSEGSWDRRGLVIGHVQSGKTANYIGAIAKAADAGYKFIIVIAGVHNNLRKQTQERIDEGFIGRSSDPKNRVNIGVGDTKGFEDKEYPCPVTLTTIYNDFNKKTADQSGWKLNDFSKPIIVVIKKNVNTLRALHRWLKDMNARGDGQISDIPVLMIDDEADNASINTNREELDPTKTNSLIRNILKLFDKSCYIGYTATPFANIFINPEGYDEDVREELFPRDFIYCLDAPNTYFGPDDVFLDDESSSQILGEIDDCDLYIPYNHKKDDQIINLPPSLYHAINQFIITRAIRNIRGDNNKHHSMMINVSRFVDIQKNIRNLVDDYINELGNAVKANYALPEKKSNQNDYMAQLREVYNENFADSKLKWSKVKSELYEVFRNLNTYLVNSKSDDSLDYKKYEKDGVSLTAIAVGGLSLSRGLTLEGLCISYMYRNTRMYDTLMQMGRWFGYRTNYDDLCRVHLPLNSIEWYAHIAKASEELRLQIKQMRQRNMSPKDFGLYVRFHPDRLQITAANKMRSAEKQIVQQNYSARIVESHTLSIDADIRKTNEALIVEYWKDGFGGIKSEETKKGWIFRDCPISIIDSFLLKFQIPVLSNFDYKTPALDFLRKIADNYVRGDVLLISPKNSDTNEQKYRLGAQKRLSGQLDEGIWTASKDRVASRNDEKLGLTKEQILQAKENALPKETSDYHYRAIRNKPLLMIHILEVKGEDKRPIRLPAFGISFPDGDYGTTIEAAVNKVWVQKMLSGFDIPEEEDDYDDEPDTLG